MGFEIASGTVCGRSHARSRGAEGRMRAWFGGGGGEEIVAVVTDGCGSGEQSEVGAWMGAHVVATAVERGIEEGMSLEGESLWESARRRTVETLARTARDMGGCDEETVKRFFLFTVVGLAISGGRACVFAAGDGLVAVNGEVLRLGPFAGNAPPYIGHALMPGLLGPAPDIMRSARSRRERWSPC